MERVQQLKKIMEIIVAQISKMEDETGLDFRQDLPQEEMLQNMIEFGKDFGLDWKEEDVKKVIEFIYF